MPGQKIRNFVEPFRQVEFRCAVSRTRNNLQCAIDAGILKRLVQSPALDQRHHFVPIPVNCEKRSAPTIHMMKRAGASGGVLILRKRPAEQPVNR